MPAFPASTRRAPELLEAEAEAEADDADEEDWEAADAALVPVAVLDSPAGGDSGTLPSCRTSALGETRSGPCPPPHSPRPRAEPTGGVDPAEGARPVMAAIMGTAPAGTTREPLLLSLATDFGDTDLTSVSRASSTVRKACRKYLRTGGA